MALRGRSAEFWIALVGTVAGVIGAAAAVAVFVIPAKTPDQSATAPTTQAASSAGNQSEPPGARPTTASTDVRYLTTLSPTVGLGFLTVAGQDLTVSCPTNQSDDTYHEVTYALPGIYTSLAAGMTVEGKADPEATASIQVFVQRQADRSDVQVQQGDPVVLAQGRSRDFVRELDAAANVIIRARCTSSAQRIKLAAPRLTR